MQFLVRNALDLSGLDRKFDTVIDSGLFHTLSDEDQPVFVESLAVVLAPGGKYFMLCFRIVGRGAPLFSSGEESALRVSSYTFTTR